MRPVFKLKLLGILILALSGYSQTAVDDKKIDAVVARAKGLVSDAELISAVEKHNEGLPKEYDALTNEKWKTLSPRDPLVLALTRNSTWKKIKQWATPEISEAFISGKDGKKIAFLSKTTSWDHSGKPKHEIPMSGKVWKGPIELDESSGINQMQVSVPILKNGSSIGSFVVGIAIARIK